MELRIAQCCGACKYVNQPKIPEPHTAHYTVAKTERWCYKHGISVTRETVCNDYEQETKKGAVPAFKRILAFNKKLKKIMEIKDWMIKNSISILIYYDKPGHENMKFSIIDNKIYYSWCNLSYSDAWHIVSCKSNYEYEKLLEAVKQYQNS